MANSKLKIPNHKQGPKDLSCGPVSLLNIYEYFGIQKSLGKIFAELKTDQNNVTYLPQLAINLLKNNLNVKYFSSNPHRVVRNWVGEDKKVIVKKFKKYLSFNKTGDWIKSDRFLQKYMELNGYFEVINLSTNFLDELLKSDHVLLLNVEQTWIYGDKLIPFTNNFSDIKGKTAGYFIVVYGSEKRNYKIIDPFSLNEEISKVDKDVLLLALSFWNPEVVAISK